MHSTGWAICEKANFLYLQSVDGLLWECGSLCCVNIPVVTMLGHASDYIYIQTDTYLS